MKKDVWLSISSKQQFTGCDEEKIDLVTAATLYERGGKYYIAYEESELTGLEGTKTTVKLDGKTVALIRTGAYPSHMLFAEDERHVGLYQTPIGAEMTAIITFVLFEAAYFAEIMRAGIQSVSKGQMSAAMALGLRYGQTMRYVILPQAVRNMLPVLLTQTIILFQDTSLVYVISGNDFMGAVSKIAQRDGQLVLMYSFAAVCYLTVSVSLSMLVRRLQRKIAVAAR